ncbi:MAG TPA: DUF222 domain-containing protein [Aquihabitans sp.]|nr:DUF222 domain-containing protein [Aquihabitans sp.]
MEMAAFEARFTDLEARVAEVVGVINAAHGQLVELVGEALDDNVWAVAGIHSPAHWLAWQAGLGAARARDVVEAARRRRELPTATAALADGTLSVDAVLEIAKHAPAAYEESITAFAKEATVPQLRRCLRSYGYGDDDAGAGRKPRRPEHERSIATGTDERGWWMRSRLPMDEGAAVEQAMKAARDDLYRTARAATPEGETPPTVTLADGLLALAEASLREGEARVPGSDRYLVHLHLEAAPGDGDPGGVLSLHLGPPLPAALRALLLCDAEVRPVFEIHGRPVSVGRRTRTIGSRLRRLIEHRDGGCAVPGCHRTSGLDIHHITHWEHGGGTDTSNLVALCRGHHRAHHLGLLGVSGDPEVQGPGGLAFADRWGRRLEPSGRPKAPRGGRRPPDLADHLGLEPQPYRHPLGERLDPGSVFFARNPDHHPPRAHPPPEAA